MSESNPVSPKTSASPETPMPVPELSASRPATLNVISLGAGVQSSAMALMAARGELTPMPEAAVFADTQGEPRSVYEWLAQLKGLVPFPVITVTQGSLANDSTRERINIETGEPYYSTKIPAFVETEAGRGMLHRKCTYDYKVVPLVRQTKRMMKEAGVDRAVQWIGISLDEAHRMKPSRERKIEHRYPLIEKKLSRWDCILWLDKHGFPQPPKSACIFCPYHSDDYWRSLKRDSPSEFQLACDYERKLTAACRAGGAHRTPFLHSSLVPLSDVDFTTDVERGQGQLFGVECEGMCGV